MNQPTYERTGGIGDGIRTGIGILTAFKEAIEETLNEAIERGDVSPERAKSLMKDAAERVQETVGEARERFDFVSRREFDALRREVDELRRQVQGQAHVAIVSPAAEGEPAATTDATRSGIPVD
jgi:polyhydroxyalkanoate synthesis regulator phasin